MNGKKEILLLNGSASAQSSNEKLIRRLERELSADYLLNIYFDLKVIPHFDPERSVGDAPAEVRSLREAIQRAAAIVICTPEYIYSIPSGLKNVLEWCVATTVFTGKPVGIITASAGGQKGHEELLLILGILGAKLSDATSLLIPGIKGKFDDLGEFKDEETGKLFRRFVDSFKVFSEEGGRG